MISRRSLLGCLTVGGLAAMASTAHAQPIYPPYGPVPELRYEPMPRPRAGFLWEPGHWHWDGRQYIWFGGHWIEARPYYRRYEPGHWVRRGPEWLWVPGHWE